jgi:hypothetical protein
LLLAMDLPGHEETPLKPGTAVTIHAGVRGRHVAMASEYLGCSNRKVGGGAEMACPVFAVPEAVDSDQRRKAFRIPITTRIVAEIEHIDATGEDDDAVDAPAAGPTALVQVQDLSFTGARLGAPEGQLRSHFAVGESVRCRMVFPGMEKVAELVALIRRADSVPAERGERQDVLGVEFQVTDVTCRRNLEFIRDYVLSEQRSLLAQRVHVLGSA